MKEALRFFWIPVLDEQAGSKNTKAVSSYCDWNGSKRERDSQPDAGF